MEYIHCHQCYRRLGCEVKLSITNCAHIFCKKCVPSTQLPKCLSCSTKNVQTITIGREMPNSILSYFNPNLQEEQKLLIKKYEFQLFQFKHLYKYLIQDEKKYEKLSFEINKRVEEYKKCISYMKFPSKSLLSQQKVKDNKKIQLNTSQKLIQSPSSSSHGRNFQHSQQSSQRNFSTGSHINQNLNNQHLNRNIDKLHAPPVPMLPSPVGSCFSEPPETSIRYSMQSLNNLKKQILQQNQTPMYKLNPMLKATPMYKLNPMLKATPMSKSIQPIRQQTPVTNLNRQMSGSNSSLASDCSSVSTSRRNDLHRQYLHGTSSQNLRSNHISPLQRRSSNSSCSSMFSMLSDNSNQLNETQSTIQSESNGKYKTNGIENINKFKQSETIHPNTQPNNRAMLQNNRKTKLYGQNISRDGTQTQNHYPSEQQTNHKKQISNNYSKPQNERNYQNDYSVLKKTNLLQMQKTKNDSRRLVNTNLNNTHRNQNEIDPRRLVNNSNNTHGNHNGGMRSVNTDRNNNILQHSSTQIRFNQDKTNLNKTSHQMISPMINHKSNFQRHSYQILTPADDNFNNRFINYRIKSQNTPDDISKTPFNGSQTPLLDSQSPNYERYLTNRPSSRFISPRTASSLSSSASQTHNKSPYERFTPSQRQKKFSDLKTPIHSPIYKQQATPPFQATLNLLTLAVQKNKL